MLDKKAYIKKEQLESWKGNYILDNGKIWNGCPDFIEVKIYSEKDKKKHELLNILKDVKREIKVKDINEFEKLEKAINDLI